LSELLQAVDDVASGRTVTKPHRIKSEPPALKRAVSQLAAQLERAFPGLPNARWVALRLLDGDPRIVEAVQRGELGELSQPGGALALPAEGRLELAGA
jgi:ferrous iron transport protein B